MPGVGRPCTTYTNAKGRERMIVVVLLIIWGLLGMSVPVLAARCSPAIDTLIVEPGSDLSLETVFNCEGGDFEVFWSGEVSVPGTIYISNGTTVKIYGASSATSPSGNSSSLSGTPASDIGGGSSSSSSSSSSSDQQDQLKELSNGMSLPTNLSAAAVGTSALGGPIFSVAGGQIVLNALAIREGNNDGGGGVYASSSNITIVDCLFENNFASDQGGGVFAESSTLIVANSTFSNNSAGFVPVEGDGEGAGGGIAAIDSAVLIDGCLFDNCYAGKEGGGLFHEFGSMSIVDSLFYNNTAGGENEESEDPIGEGGAISLTGCSLSFDGSPACEIRNTVFSGNAVAEKGGAVIIAAGDNLSTVEFHGCVISNNSAGSGALLDDPQGEGGAITVGPLSSVLLADCLVENNWAGKKGGVLNLSGGENWTDAKGASVILRNSRFSSNRGILNNAGVVMMNDFTNATVVGDENVFENNTCAQGGAVFGADTYSFITVEGGTFVDNAADVQSTAEDVWSKGEQSGGVFWTKGEVIILGGTYINNAAKHGGVFQAAEGSSVVIDGGTFESNTAENGGVAYALVDGSLEVKDGVFTGNFAKTGGGAFFVEGGADIEITGGSFSSNEADFGGFIYKEGDGVTTCAGAVVLLHKGVDGGAIYAVDGARVDWNCDLKNNSALVGPAIYARENANVTLRELEAADNFVTRGSVMFIDNSTLSTDQVVISDATSNTDLSAVQTDTNSTFVAERTSFVGFVGEVVVFSEGRLFLDECDFSGSSAAALVFAGQEENTVIRNAVLGEKNYESEAADASKALRLPSADNFINVRAACDSSPPPCSDGSWCLDGDLGVYCQRYSLRSSSEEVCTGAGVDNLTLNDAQPPGTTYYPNLLEGELHLSLAPSPSDTATSTEEETSATTSSSCIGTTGRVAWSVLGPWSSTGSTSIEDLGNWTVFPSTGLLLPGENATLRIVGKPDESFNGFATVTFGAHDFASLSSSSSSASSPSTLESDSEQESKDSEATFDVEYYFCSGGNVWDSSVSAVDADVADGCRLCTVVIEGAIEDACKGGTTVDSVQEYCNEGYEGPYCAVCEPGYGRGVADSCHACTASFQGGMYFLLAVVLLLAIVVVVLLACFLVGGKDAVSSTVSSTKQSVLNLRGSTLLTHSENRKPRSGFFGFDDSASIGGTGDTATTAQSLPSVGSQFGVRHRTSARSGEVAASSKNKNPVGKIGVLLSAIPLSKLKIVIVVWQISNAFTEITKVSFPPIYEKFLSVIGVFSFDLGWILSAACLTTDIGFYDKLLIVTIGPLVPLCFLGLTFYIGSAPARRTSAEANPGQGSAASSRTNTNGGNQGYASALALWSSVREMLRAGSSENRSSSEQEHLWGLFARHTTIMLIFLYLVYTQISTVVFQAFACEDLTELSKSYLRADLRIECYTPQHTGYRVYAAIMIFFYPLGIPAVFLYFLLRQRSRINPPTDETLAKLRGEQHAVRKLMADRDEDPTIAPTSFLWSVYFPKCYYFEVFECIRRLLLTGLLVFLVPDTPGQVAFSCIFAILSLMTFELLRPHVDSLDRQLYRTGCLVILFTNFLALVIKAGVASKDSSGSTAYSVVLIIVNVMFFLSICGNTWTTVKAMLSRRHAQGVWLGVDVVGDETVDKVLGPKTKRPAGRNADEYAKADDERPSWDVGDASTPQIVSAFGGNNGDGGGLPLSSGTAPDKVSAFGGHMRGALAKIAPGSQGLSASDTPVRRVSLHQRQAAAGRLVPVSPTAAPVLPTASSGETK